MILKYKNVKGYLIHFEIANDTVDMARVILQDIDTLIQYRFNCYTKDLEVVSNEINDK